MLTKDYTLGVDIGSTTVKVALLDANKNLIFSDYKRHFANIRETMQDLVQEAYDHKKSQLPIVREEINRLQEQEYETSDYERIRSIQRQVEEKKAFLEKLKSDIEDIEKKLNA